MDFSLDFLNDQKKIVKYWNKEVSLFIDQKSLSSSLPSATELVNFFTGNLISGNWVEPLNVKINASCINREGSYQQLLSISIDEARSRYLNGFSLCFGDMSLDINQIAALKTKAAEIFGYADLISVTGYLSPPKVNGVLHFDRQHNFFIQKEGTKRWFVSEKPATKNPHENLVYAGITQSFLDNMNARGYGISLPRDCGRNTYELNPGDVLYVPPGFYHSPETLDAPSLHYTLTVEPACFWKDFNKDMFSKLLSSDGKFFQDYRFLSENQKYELVNDCLKLIMSEQK
jgi:hypothetical protein